MYTNVKDNIWHDRHDDEHGAMYIPTQQGKWININNNNNIKKKKHCFKVVIFKIILEFLQELIVNNCDKKKKLIQQNRSGIVRLKHKRKLN